MAPQASLTAEWHEGRRLGGLRRFAVAITVLNLLGHGGVLGFEQSWAQPVTALVVAYSLEIVFEWLDAALERRRPRFRGGLRPLVDFLLSAHITAMAVAMLLYASDRLGPMAFATAVAISSKHLLRVQVRGRVRHFLNPSNFGIAVTLLVFPWVGIAPPYMFSENLTGVADWVLPGVMIMAGSFLNARFTRKLPLIGGWLAAFALQAWIRSAVFETPAAAALAPMTGPAFLLFTFYMVTDPATTPVAIRAQICFGAAVAAVYAVLLVNHVVYGLFFALGIVCIGRGVLITTANWLVERSQRASVPAALEAP